MATSPQSVLAGTSQAPISLNSPFWEQLTYDLAVNGTVSGGEIDIVITPELNDKAIVIQSVHCHTVTASETSARLQIRDSSNVILMSEQFRVSSIHSITLDIRTPLVMQEDEEITIKLTGASGTNITAGNVTCWFAALFKGKTLAHPTKATV